MKIFLALVLGMAVLTSCSDRQDLTITGPQVPGTVSYTYLKPFFDNRCATANCHSTDIQAGGYDMSTYSGVIAQATAGNTNSTLLVKIRPGGSMNKYLGDYHETKIDAVTQWVVDDNLAEN